MYDWISVWRGEGFFVRRGFLVFFFSIGSISRCLGWVCVSRWIGGWRFFFFIFCAQWVLFTILLR
jgi:hypothetical protein